jgi:transposase
MLSLRCETVTFKPRFWAKILGIERPWIVVAQVPRVKRPGDGARRIEVPWADGHSGFTALFEQHAISLLQEMSISAAARPMRLSWDQIDGIMQRAIDCGFAVRKDRIVKHLGIDEKSLKKRHKCVTIVSDLDGSEMFWVAGRKRETLDAFWESLFPEQLAGIEGVAMDMWPAYIESTLALLSDAEEKIVFDKFHVMRYLTHAVDLERRSDVRSDFTLKKTRYQWLRRPGNMSYSGRIEFAQLRKAHERLDRPWAIKETFDNIWSYTRDWYSWAIRSRFRHMKDIARLIARHIENILTYLQIPITNAASESVNSKIQWFKYQKRGFRNETRFMRAILLHCGGLDVFPTHLSS